MKLNRILALTASAVFFSSAHAEPSMVYKGRSLEVRLTSKACTNPAFMAVLRQGGDGEAKSASVLDRGRAIEACWIVDGDGDVLITDSDGSVGYLPTEAFTPDVGI